MSKIREIQERLNKVLPTWTAFGGNIPFYVDVQKPRPSLSKHDNERPTYWHYDDGAFVAAAPYDMQFLLEILESQEVKIEELQCEIEVLNDELSNQRSEINV